jgi:SOS-response transcriptional repressor LexA
MADGPDTFDWQVLGFLQRVAQERDHPPLSDEACRTLRTSQERLETSLKVLQRLGYVTANTDTPLGYEVVPTQPPIHDLTPQQVPIVDAIARLCERLGHPTTVREIGVEAQRSPAAVHACIKRLEHVDWVRKSPGRKRTIELLKPWPPVAAGDTPQDDRSVVVPHFVFIPHLGQAAAGRGVAAERVEDGGLWLPREMVGGDPSNLFALRITGDSMNATHQQRGRGTALVGRPGPFGDQRPGGHPHRWQPEHRPEMERQAGAAGMVASGGVDHQHVRGDRQGADGLLEQGAFPEGEQGRQIGPAGGPADTRPGQQAAAVSDGCAGEASVTCGTSSLDRLEADEAGADPG